jgi:hypothetical protein
MGDITARPESIARFLTKPDFRLGWVSALLSVMFLDS